MPNHLLPSSCGGFSFKSYCKLMPNALLAALLLLWYFFIQFLLETDAECSSGCPRPLVLVSYTILIENWCQMLFWTPSSCGGFPFNSYWKLMPNALLAALLLLCWFSFQFLLETDAECSSGCPLLLCWFPLQFLLKTDAEWSSGCPPGLVVVPDSIRIENW